MNQQTSAGRPPGAAAHRAYPGPSTGPPSPPHWTGCGVGRRRTPPKASRTPPTAGPSPWWRSAPGTPPRRRAPAGRTGAPVPPHVLPTRRRPRLRNYWTKRRGAEAMDYSYALMDLTVYGRQESWEDSPPGWPQQCTITRTDGGPPDWPPVPAWPGGRPIAQWSRLVAGRSDDLATGHDVPQ